MAWGLVLWAATAMAQPLSNQRSKTLAYTQTLTIDSLSVIPGSLVLLTLQNDTISPTQYSVSYPNSTISFLKPPLGDSIRLSYRVFPYRLGQSYFKKNIDSVRADNTRPPNPFQIKDTDGRDDIFALGGLQKNGAITRGISFGNNQDVVVNSNLNLQLAGKIGDNIELTAAISDENIPIQPDGNTAQLQDFDRVYIQLATDRTKLVAGDFQINRPENTYFMNFNKRLQGASFTTQFDAFGATDKRAAITNKITGSAAIARGRFARNNIQGIEGNQGPYRLRGNNNESFIIILSGSEKVYIDGRLLKRGQENDYVIDYNLAEVTFTSKIMLTKDLRIFIEFEYADNNYSRTLFYVGNTLQGSNFRVNLNYYNEQDLKNQPLQQQLSPTQLNILQAAGDNPVNAVVPNVDTVAFNPNEVLYRAIDTLVNGIPTVKYIYSIDEDLAIYRVGFAQVGLGQGNYVLASTLANGRVFRWVDPIGAQPQGNYSPITQLVAPKQRQLGTVGGEYNLGKKLKVGGEAAISVNNLNTLSTLDKQDDTDIALRFYLEKESNLERKDTIDPWKLTTTISYEQVNRSFAPLERFRNVEFDRDWNLTTLSQPATQYLPALSLNLKNTTNGTAGYRFTSFLAGSQYNGFQNALNTDLTVKGFKIFFTGSQTQSQGQTLSTQFIRHRANISKGIFKNKLLLGFKDEHEYNIFRADTLQRQSYQFYDFQFSVGNADTAKVKANTFYRRRTDYNAAFNRLNQTAVADWAGLTVELPNLKFGTIKLLTTFRQLRIVDTTLTAQEPDNSLVNRFEYNLKLLKGGITGSTFYEVGSGLEQRRQFAYVQVPAGQGVYAWVDYDNNGIKEINEFEISPFPDQAQYIRVFTPTTEFVKTYTNQFNQVLNINVDKLIKNKEKGWGKFFAKFSNQTAYRVDQKTLRANLGEALNPFRQNIDNTELISLNSSARNTLFFNRNSTVYGIDINWQDIRNKTLLVNGVESRQNTATALRTRWNASKKITLNFDIKQGKRASDSEIAANRNFTIAFYELEPRFIFQPNAQFRLTLNYIYANKRNAPTLGGERSANQNAGVDLKYNQTNKGSLQGKLNFISIAYNGNANSPLAFEMLEGLRPGSNFTWGISYQRNLTSNLQINLTYDGRAPQGTRVIHTGGLQARALF